MHTVKFKNSLAIHDFIYSTLIKKLVLKIKEIENFESLKLNPELTRYILSCIYKEVILIGKSWSKTVDIKEILIHILKTAFNLNTDEVDQLIAQIDFILDNSLVKKKSPTSKFAQFVKSSLNPFSPSIVLETSPTPLKPTGTNPNTTSI